MAGTAFTINSTTTGRGSVAGAAGVEEGGKKPWTVIGYSTDIITDIQVLRAAPSTGKQYLESISISCEALATGETISVMDDADLQIGPIPTLGEWFENFGEDGLAFQGAIGLTSSATRPIMVIAKGYDT